MPRTPIPILAGEGQAKSKFVSSRTLVNCFLEASNGQPALYGGPGFSLRVTLATGPLRGAYAFGDVLIAVGGNRLYTVTQGGTATDRGEVLGSTPVDISDNGLQCVIVAEDAEKSYYWDGTTFGEITDPDFFVASSVDFVDQYIITTVKDSGTFQISALADGTDWSALDIATAEARPDKNVRVWVDNRDVLIFGTKTIEGNYNSGNADFPFERSQLFFEIGLAGRDAIAAVDNSIAFLARDAQGGLSIRLIRGGTPIIISNPAIMATVESWSDVSTAQAFGYSFRNHQFWCLRHADGCIIWDASAPPQDAWHIRKSYGSETWRVGYAVGIWGVTVLGDATTGKLYTLDPDTHSEAGTTLERYVRSAPLGPGAFFTLNSVEAMIEPGVGILTGQGSDPKVWLRLSRNSGKRWGARMERRLGERGEDEKFIAWKGGFGQFRPEGGVLDIGISDPVPFVMKGATADYTLDVT